MVLTLVVLIGGFLVSSLLGLPIFFAFLFGTLMAFLVDPVLDINYIMSTFFYSLNNYPLLAIPLFIYAGELMVAGKTSRKLINFASIFMGKFPGYLGSLTVVSSAFYGAVSGSAPATAAAVGSMMAPDMKKSGYPRGYTGALISASGMLGMLIPPSVPFILFGFATSTSITDLFIAGIGPGFLMVVLYVLWNIIYVKKTKLVLCDDDTESASLSNVTKFKEGIWAIFMPVIILGGIYSGIFTPTEAAAVSCIYAAAVGLFVYKGLDWKGLVHTTRHATYTILTLMMGLVFITMFIRIVTFLNAAEIIAAFLTSVTSSKILLLLMINLFLLIWGMFMDPLAGCLMLGPLFYNLVVVQLGLDPIQYGVMMVVNLGLGVTTPPLSINTFIGMRQSGATLPEIVKPLFPFIIIGIVLILMVTFIPAISLFFLK